MLGWLSRRKRAPEDAGPPPPVMINEVTIASGGRIGMCACPGRSLFREAKGTPADLLRVDIDAIAAWGASGVVSLLDPPEVPRYGLETLAEDLEARGLFWMNLPIRDMRPPDTDFEQAWITAGPELRRRLASGEGIVFHCLAGLGRTGTIAGRLLVELGYDAERAIHAIRNARPGAIQTPAQEAHVRATRKPI